MSLRGDAASIAEGPHKCRSQRVRRVFASQPSAGVQPSRFAAVVFVRTQDPTAATSYELEVHHGVTGELLCHKISQRSANFRSQTCP